MNNIAEVLKDLRRSLSRVKDLSAWLDLKSAESPPSQSYISLMHDPTEFDLKTEIGFFLKLSSDLKETIEANPSAITAPSKARLRKLETEFWSLSAPLLLT